MKQQQKFDRYRNAKAQAEIKEDDEQIIKMTEAQAKRMEELRKRNESIRRATYDKDRKQYQDRQRKLANLVDQLALMNEVQNSSVQENKTNTIQQVYVQESMKKSTVRIPNVATHQPVQEKVIIKEVTPKDEPIARVQQKPEQALVPKKQKSSFMQHFGAFTHKISEAAVAAYEMFTFKHNRDVAVGKRKEKTVSPTEASTAYENTIDYYSANYRSNTTSRTSANVRKGNEKPISFKEHLQSKADEKAAMEAMKFKAKNENTRGSGQRGA